MAPIAVGDVIPDGTLSYLDEEDQVQSVSIHSLAAGKKVVFFSVPGAFTPTCSTKHVPGVIDKSEELKLKGVDEIVLVSVNDPYVMKAWEKTYPKNKYVKFLADGPGKYANLLGLELDLSEKGLGLRSRRYALFVEDLKVTIANVESGGEFTVSSAEDILKALLVKDHKVSIANVESGGEFTVSSADDILKALLVKDHKVSSANVESGGKFTVSNAEDIL